MTKNCRNCRFSRLTRLLHVRKPQKKVLHTSKGWTLKLKLSVSESKNRKSRLTPKMTILKRHNDMCVQNPIFSRQRSIEQCIFRGKFTFFRHIKILRCVADSDWPIFTDSDQDFSLFCFFRQPLCTKYMQF